MNIKRESGLVFEIQESDKNDIERAIRGTAELMDAFFIGPVTWMRFSASIVNHVNDILKEIGHEKPLYLDLDFDEPSSDSIEVTKATIESLDLAGITISSGLGFDYVKRILEELEGFDVLPRIGKNIQKSAVKEICLEYAECGFPGIVILESRMVPMSDLNLSPHSRPQFFVHLEGKSSKGRGLELGADFEILDQSVFKLEDLEEE